jgi:hypothetical protein
MFRLTDPTSNAGLPASAADDWARRWGADGTPNTTDTVIAVIRTMGWTASPAPDQTRLEDIIPERLSNA